MQLTEFQKSPLFQLGFCQQKQLNDILLQIGGLETQKHSLLHRIKNVNEGIEETKKSLEEKYGTINVNLEDGTYTEIKKEDE